MMQSWRHEVDERQQGQRLDKVVVGVTAWSRNQVKRAVAAGAIRIDGQVCRQQGRSMRSGEVMDIHTPNPDRDHIDQGQLRILFEDDLFLIIDKPAGLPTQPPPRGGDALSRRVGKHLSENPANKRAADGKPYVGLVHRLDRDASGLIVVGKRKDSTAALSWQLRRRRLRRHYVALVRTAWPPTAGWIEEPIAEADKGLMRCHPTGKPARTQVVPMGFDPQARLALVGLTLDTGRTHQVRVHLAWAVGAIAGDSRYGDPYPGASRVALHGVALQLSHPNGDAPMRWQSTPQTDFWQPAAGSSLALPADWARRLEAPDTQGV